MNVCVLAGGRGSRLANIWDRPKCLVPVNGRPVIERVLENVARAKPDTVILMLGHNWRDGISQWLRERRADGLRVIPMIEDVPAGTAPAVRRAIGASGPGPLLVLNGDTVPAYELGALVDFHGQRMGSWASAAMRRGARPYGDVYAGACVLSEEAQEEIYADTRTVDFPAHLVGALPFYVPGFLDVGTPEGFERAKAWELAA